MFRRSSSRHGLTLIELLVVISLILVFATLALVISPRLSEDQRSARAADLVSGWLLMSKQRAYRDQQDRGIRLIPDPDNPNFVRKIEFIERPEDFRGGILECPSPAPPASWEDPPPGSPERAATIFIHGVDLTNNNFTQSVFLNPDLLNLPNPFIVEPGDFFVHDTRELVPYNSHRIMSLRWVAPGTLASAPQGGTHLVLAAADGSPGSAGPPATPPVPPSYYSPFNDGVPVLTAEADRNFRFVRRARPLVGEQPVELPRDMIIDLTPPPLLPGGSIRPGGSLDILFSPRGQVVGENGIGGKIVLRLRNDSRGTTDGDQLYVVIFTRSGVIAAHPMDTTDLNNDGVPDNPYRFLLDGNTSGF